MNIAVFGWYGHQNAGDDRIQHCITRWFDGDTLSFLPAGRAVPIEFLHTQDAVVIGGGGLIYQDGGLFRNMASWVREAGIPVALAGVSIEAYTPTVISELREFLDVCCFAWFRDEESAALLGPHPNAFVAPDLTWLHPIQLDRDPGTGVAVALKKSGLRDEARWREALRALGVPLHSWPLYFEAGGDVKILAQLLPDETDLQQGEFSLRPIERSSTVVTNRFHGLLFAIQAGRPAIAVGDIPKIRRFLSEHGLGDWRVDEGNPESLLIVWERLVSNLDGARGRVHEIGRHLHEQASENAGRAKDMLRAAVGQRSPIRTKIRRRLRTALNFGRFIP